MEIKLQKIIELKGKLVLESNLHIGSGNMDMHIGGTDNPIIKHPHTLEPYIPGSSIKGKVRSLIELSTGVAQHAYSKNSKSGGMASLAALKSAENELKEEVADILKIFGYSGSDKTGSDDAETNITLGPTRVSFADCYLNKEWKEKAVENLWPLSVDKSENSIDRISGVASNPRFTEVVPAGAEFDFRLSFKIFCDKDKKLFEKLKKGLDLLAKDALGGSGSRGYGRIRFEDLREE